MTDGSASKKRLWEETGGEKKYLAEQAAKEAEMERLTAGLAECPVCKGKARIVIFGAKRHGVWVGCDKTEECSRYVECHTEGWSIAETAGDWNRRNRGWRKVVRRIKRWYRQRFGAERRARKRAEKEYLAKKEARMTKMREVFGIIEPEREKKWWKFWRMGNK